MYTVEELIGMFTNFFFNRMFLDITAIKNYENISKHFDADIIVNTTPVGMYPKTGVSPVELKSFKNVKFFGWTHHFEVFPHDVSNFFYLVLYF